MTEDRGDMNSGEVRKGVTQAKFNADYANVVFGEIGLIAIAVGVYCQSWYVFGGVLLGLICTMMIPLLNIILAITLSVIWGGIGYEIGTFFSTQASYVICGLSFLSGIGIHLAAIEWSKDIGSTSSRNF